MTRHNPPLPVGVTHERSPVYVAGNRQKVFSVMDHFLYFW